MARMRVFRVLFVSLIVLSWIGCGPVPLARVKPTPPEAKPSSDTRQFTFAWRYGTNDGSMAPRGGTSHGPAVTLDTKPGEAWQRLRAPGLSAVERDRRAVLAHGRHLPH